MLGAPGARAQVRRSDPDPFHTPEKAVQARNLRRCDGPGGDFESSEEEEIRPLRQEIAIVDSVAIIGDD